MKMIGSCKHGLGSSFVCVNEPKRAMTEGMFDDVCREEAKCIDEQRRWSWGGLCSRHINRTWMLS